ncbi:MAG: hypothetical protein N2749_03525 [Clostridia bacterium]|nr:hypothetical protein [Clostridia bacterium]
MTISNNSNFSFDDALVEEYNECKKCCFFNICYISDLYSLYENGKASEIIKDEDVFQGWNSYKNECSSKTWFYLMYKAIDDLLSILILELEEKLQLKLKVVRLESEYSICLMLSESNSFDIFSFEINYSKRNIELKYVTASKDINDELLLKINYITKKINKILSRLYFKKNSKNIDFIVAQKRNL